MSSIRVRPESGNLYFDLHHRGVRCKEYTTLRDTVANRKKMAVVLDKIESEISLGTFEYARYFPNSKLLPRFAAAKAADLAPAVMPAGIDTPLFRDFLETWKTEKKVEWRHSYLDNVESLTGTHLIPYFGDKRLHEVDRPMVLAFRTQLAAAVEREDGTEKTRKATTINRIIGLLRQIFDEAVLRYGGVNPCTKIKRLKLQKTDVEPFSIDQVQQLISTIRRDYKEYITVRLFTGMRPGEANGLKWKFVDFEKRQILVRETYTKGRTEYTKTDGSQREIAMSVPVYEALLAIKPETIDPEAYVFHTATGLPLDNKNFTNRVWYPLLRHLGLKKRTPYQMRHTCATLWLGSGEQPEWVARQLGHANTEMLFRIYSRFIPNLTRRDGSAFDRMLAGAITTTAAMPKEVTHD